MQNKDQTQTHIHSEVDNKVFEGKYAQEIWSETTEASTLSAPLTFKYKRDPYA